MPAALLVLALSAFAIGTTEFVIMGLLPEVAGDLGVSIPGAGWLVTGYALGVGPRAPPFAPAPPPRARENPPPSLVPANRRASAVALMFTGLTLANVLGVPLGTALGQYAGWRSTFWAVTLIGEVTGVSPNGVTCTLLLIGLGLTLGNVLGGRLADRSLKATLIGVFVAMAVISTLFSWTSQALIPAEITLFLWATAAFAAVPALQVNVVAFGSGAPNLVSTLNIGAFNLGNALGAWVGGLVIAEGFGLTRVPLAAAALAVLALLATLLTFSTRSPEPELALNE